MAMIKCCKDCTEREIGCHGWCERYLAAKAKLDEVRAAKNKQMDIICYAYGVARDKRTIDAKAKQQNRKRHFGGRR